MMTSAEQAGRQQHFQVVTNHEGQYSIWKAGALPPAGWEPDGFEGPKDACLEHIGAVWTDMRPLSVRMSEEPPR